VRQAPVVASTPAVSQPAAPVVTTAPASPRVTSAPVKNARRDDTRELLDQVPSGLRKRFGF
jgi:hypothetical protein